MLQLVAKIRRFLTSEEGPTAVEYAVMLALIVIVCLASIRTIGTSCQNHVHDDGQFVGERQLVNNVSVLPRNDARQRIGIVQQIYFSHARRIASAPTRVFWPMFA